MTGSTPVPTAPSARCRQTLWATLVLSLAAAVALHASGTLRVIATGLIAPLFPAAASGDAQFLAVGVAALALMLALTRHSSASLWTRPDPGLLLLAACGFALGLGMLMFFEYAEAFDLPWSLPAHHWAGAAHARDALLDIRLGETALSALWPAPGTDPPAHAGSDGARVLLRHLPAAERWALALLWLAACVLALASAPSIARRYAWHPVALALYGLAALSCLSAIAAGGALAPALPPALLMLALLACARDTADLVQRLRRHAWIGLLAIAACAAGSRALASNDAASAWIATATPLAAYGLGLLCWVPRDRIRASVRAAAITACAACLALAWLQQAVSGAGALLQPIAAGTRVVVVDPYELVARDAAAVVAGQTPLAIYRRFGDDPLRPRRVLIAIRSDTADTATPPGRELAFALRLIAGRAAAQADDARDQASAADLGRPDAAGAPADRSAASSLYSLLAATRSAGRVNTAVFVFRTASPEIAPFFAAEPSVLGHNNFHVHLHLVAATLRRQGLEEFVLMPLLRARDRDLFLPAGSRPERG